jgi:lipopolysaccharide export system protein LptA
MKRLYLLLTAAACGFAAVAETNTTIQTANRPAAATNAPVEEEVSIDSEKGEFDAKTGWVIYTAHVKLDHPTMKLTCEWLTGNKPSTNDPAQHIIARTNVVADLVADQGKNWHVTGIQAIYDKSVRGTVTNETVTIYGDPRAVATSADTIIKGQPLVYDLVAKKYWGTNFDTKFIIPNRSVNATNSAAGKTNHGSAFLLP